MNIHPLPSALHSQLVDAGVESFELNFDRRLGDLDVSTYIPDRTTSRAPLEQAIELWAAVYDYNFDTSDDDGDTIVYGLLTEKVTHHAWYMKRHYEETTCSKLQLVS